MRHLAPAGAPIAGRDLLRWAVTCAGPHDPARLLRDGLTGWSGATYCHLTSSGRAGMTIIMRALRVLDQRDRDEVIIPSYTCCSIAASVIKAGLRPRLADISTETLDFNYSRLGRADFRRVLAIVGTNLYGLPSDMARLTELARERGVFLVDDSAQALGASLRGVKSGAWGDVGLYSFDKGKNVSAIEGGAILTRSAEISDAIACELNRLPPTGPGALLQTLVKVGAYSSFLQPRLYWIPNSFPQLGLGTTVYTTDFPLARYAPPLAALAGTMLQRLGEFTSHRRACAKHLMSKLSDLRELRVPIPAPSSEPVYLRLPLLLPSRQTRDAALVALNNAGVGASRSYPVALADIPELNRQLIGSGDDTAGAREIAERIMTLPTHPYVTGHDIDLMVTTLQRVLRDSPVQSPACLSDSVLSLTAGTTKTSVPQSSEN